MNKVLVSILALFISIIPLSASASISPNNNTKLCITESEYLALYQGESRTLVETRLDDHRNTGGTKTVFYWSCVKYDNGAPKWGVKITYDSPKDIDSTLVSDIDKFRANL